MDEIKKRAYPYVLDKQHTRKDTLMKKNKEKMEFRPQKDSVVWSPLEEIAREGARKMIEVALGAEVQEFLDKHAYLLDDEGKQQVTRNGYSPERELITGIGKMAVKQPRIDDRKIRKDKNQQVFTSQILPKYMRRIASIDNLLPVLYLKGISTGAFPSALSSILGENAKGLSSNVIVRLKSSWEEDYKNWNKRDLGSKKYVYFWVDGIYFNARLEGERSCILVIVAADQYGNKELLAVSDGVRESKITWKEILLDLKNRGLRGYPKLGIGDGALGFWSALREVFPDTKEQRCWVHKTANVLDKVPKKIQGKVKSAIHEMYMAETKNNALQAYDRFIKIYGDKYPKAIECLSKDKDQLFCFYDFPAAHWRHIRTTNPIESTFATVRLRTKRTKGCGTRNTTLTMVWKLATEAQKTWIKLHGHKSIIHILAGKKFVDGIAAEDLDKAA